MAANSNGFIDMVLQLPATADTLCAGTTLNTAVVNVNLAFDSGQNDTNTGNNTIIQDPPDLSPIPAGNCSGKAYDLGITMTSDAPVQICPGDIITYTMELIHTGVTNKYVYLENEHHAGLNFV